ncbi:hypothetical protein [Mucilaginibacter sp.]|jgi:hypothetical protein|uniref:hypothetical protein n=1 Tax=Mucilaginibacter sp. TaxID=1882438 RepID=UPI0035630EC8
MKILAYILFILFFGFVCEAQKPANISITLENSTQLQINHLSLFEKAGNYLLTKQDETHYTLTYNEPIPGILYLNLKPIYITPGDNIQLTWRLVSKTMDEQVDSLLATGVHSGNYIYSNYIMTKKLDSYFPDFDGAKYQKNPLLLYQDLNTFEKVYFNYFDKILTSLQCSPALIGFVKRAEQNQFFFNMIYFENELYKSNNPGLGNFSKTLDDSFLATRFLPGDTHFNFVQENLFKRYLTRLVQIKFKQLTSHADAVALFNYINKYPNAYVREYFLYFLVKEYNSKAKLLNRESLEDSLQTITNVDIKDNLKNYIDF